MLKANCCVLNGGHYYHNDFTYVSTKHSSVVDYCVIPYENLRHYKHFEVMRASAISGIFEHIPDHSILCWEFETNFSVEKSNSVHNNVKQNQNKFISYNVKNIPNDWMTDLNVINSINECINNIEYSNGS